MLNRDYPFDSSQEKKMMYDKQQKRDYMSRWREAVIKALTPDVQDLIYKMLEPDPKERLSMEEVCKHPWFPLLDPPEGACAKTRKISLDNKAVPKESADKKMLPKKTGYQREITTSFINERHTVKEQ